MTSHSDANPPFASKVIEPNWKWLQSRLDSTQAEQFGLWIDKQLAILEVDFANMTTRRSRSLAACSQRESDQDRGLQPDS